jgi:hypothetical protein
MAVGFPDQFICATCGAGIDPHQSSTLRLVTGWVKGPGGKTVHHVERSEWKYLHDWCLRQYVGGAPEPDSLF